MTRLLATFVAGLLVMAGGVAWWTRGDWRHVTAITGPTTAITTDAVEEVVTGLRPLDRLVVFQAALVAVTDATECRLLCAIKSLQTLITPGYVDYYVDMGALDARALMLADGRLTVRLPPLGIERPNADIAHLRFFNDGVWSHITSADRRLEAKTRAMAAVQLTREAQQAYLVELARKQAASAVFADIRAILNATGHRDLSLTVRF
ncbi:DUF4230 domain-containing protein [Sphingomonas bacterium]|uniref:DUF4230 domain-containing protein n=1 Tax=Sphingomonas bacterium TaxID=1895847 RepID=UPI001577129E|nr:DUF4230 domain-containing protein [Sphingomonas bacterium]